MIDRGGGSSRPRAKAHSVHHSSEMTPPLQLRHRCFPADTSVYLLWFVLRGRLLPGSSGVLATLGAGWALVEAVFGVYYQHLARKVQPIAPPISMKPEDLSDLYLRVMHAGLAYSAPGNRYVRERAEGHRHSVYGKEIPTGGGMGLPPPNENATEGEAASAYAAHTAVPSANGGINVAEFAAATADRRKRGRLYSAAADTMGNAEQFMDPQEEDDPLFDENGNPHVLAADDPLAVEFREQLRTWYVEPTRVQLRGNSSLLADRSPS